MKTPLPLLLTLMALTGMISLNGCGGCTGGEGGSNTPGDASTSSAPSGHGTISLAWELSDLGGQPIQCDQVSASTVSLAMRGHGQATGAADSFTCIDSPSTSKEFLPGNYDVSLKLNAGDETIATVPDQISVGVEDGMSTLLAPITFVVDDQGSLALTLTTTDAASNCKAPIRMGAGITGITITLVQMNGGCAPVTFERAKGGTLLTPYTVNCSSPSVAACIENDETLTVTSLASGPYTIHIRGKIGALECWKSDDTLQIPPIRKTLTKTISLTRNSENTLCP